MWRTRHYPFAREFRELGQPLSCGVFATRVSRDGLPHQNRVKVVRTPKTESISIEDYSNSDTSSELEHESNQGSVAGSSSDEDRLDKNLEPGFSETIHDNNTPRNPQAQLQAQNHLAKLHADIKARAQLPDPAYQKLLRSRSPRPFAVQILPDHVQHLIHYFELFWGSEI